MKHRMTRRLYAMTHKQIADELGCSADYVAEVERSAIGKLRLLDPYILTKLVDLSVALHQVRQHAVPGRPRR